MENNYNTQLTSRKILIPKIHLVRTLSVLIFVFWCHVLNAQTTEPFNVSPTLISHPSVPSWKTSAEVTIDGVVYELTNGGNGGWEFSPSGGVSNSSCLLYSTAATTSVTIKRKDGQRFQFYGVWLKYTNAGGYPSPYLTVNYVNSGASSETYSSNTTVNLSKNLNVTSVTLAFSGLLDLYFDNLIVGPAMASAPTVTTSAAYNVAGTLATLGGNVTNDGGGTITERGVVYSTTPNPTTANAKATMGSGTGAFSGQVSGLNFNTTYYARAYAINSAATSYGSQITFTTTDGSGPVVINPIMDSAIDDQGNYPTDNTLYIGNDPDYGYGFMEGFLKFSLPLDLTGSVQEAKLRVNVNYMEGSNIFLRAYGSNDDSWLENTMTVPSKDHPLDQTNVDSHGWIEIDVTSFVQNEFNGDKVVTLVLNGNNSGMSYVGIGSRESVNSPELILVMSSGPSLPTITTSSATSIGSTSATLGGNVTADGGDAVSERGIVWSTSSNPTTADNKVQMGSGTGSFSQTVPELPVNSTIYVRAYGINSEGTSYGEEVSFTTLKISQSITFPVIDLKTYGDAPFTLGEEETDQGLTVTYTAGDPSIVNIMGNQATVLKAGTTTITASQAGDDSHAGAEPVERTLTVEKANLTLTVDPGQSKVYGAGDPVFSYAATGFVNGDDASVLTGALSRSGGEGVGMYPITQGTLEAGDNYVIDFLGLDFEITQATLTISVDPDQSKVYGAADPVFSYAATGLANGDDTSVLTGALSRSGGEGVGMYPINQGTLDAGGNYVIDFVGLDFEITQATLAISVDPDQNKVYGSADPVFSYDVIGLANGDDTSVLTGALSRTTGEAVGIYPINQGTLEAGDNYVIDFLGLDFEITQATLTISVDPDQSKVYGAGDPVFSYDVIGLANGDDGSVLTGALSRSGGEGVGIYPINQGTLDAGGNYVIDFVGLDFEITQATLTISVDPDQSKVYGTGDPVFSYAATGFVNGDDASVLTGALSRSAGEAVGIYPINQGTLEAGGNYVIDFLGADFEITKATLTISVDPDQNKVYGSADPVFSYDVIGLANGDDASVLTGALSRTTGEAVGIYPINQGTLEAGDNYVIGFVGADFEITKATLTINVDPDQSKVYGAGDPVFSYAATGYVNGDDGSVLTGALSRSAGEGVGMYTITQGTLEAGDNYVIDFLGADFEITQATLTISVAPDQSKIYGAADPVFSYAATGFANGDDTSVLTGALSRSGGEGVGMYPINQGTLDAGGNYVIDFVGLDFEITQATLTISVAPDQNKVYGSADPVFSYDVIGLANGDDASVLTGALSRTTGEAVGIYPINQGTLEAGDNYVIDFLGLDFEITRATLTITADNKSKVYGAENPKLTFSYSGLVNGDTGVDSEPDISTTATASSGVGTYPIILDGGSDANYEITLESGELEVTKATVTITADGQSKVYGDANPVLTFSYSGLVNGDTGVDSEPDISTTATASSGVGTYPIILDGGSDANYEITLESGELEVIKAAVTITADGQSKVYGDANPALTFSYSGLVNGDTGVDSEPGISTTATAGSGVGTYPIILDGGSDVNYEITLESGKLEVTKAAVTITADGQSKVYGDANPALTFSYSGLVNGDTGVDSEPVISTTATAGSGVGTYPITWMGGLDANYEITLVEAELEVTPAILNIKAVPGQFKIHGTSDPELAYTVSGLTAWDDTSVISGKLDREAGETVGIYTIGMGNISGGNNYILSFTSAEFEIQMAELVEVISPANIETPWSMQPELPKTVLVMTEDGRFLEIPVAWSMAGLNLMSRGEYSIIGELVHSEGISNPRLLEAQLSVTVLAKKAPMDILLDNDNFIADSNREPIEVGMINIEDIVDDVHHIELIAGAADNAFFEVSNNYLYWNSSEAAAGKSDFMITLRVTDRDGNVLEKNFSVTRLRRSLKEIVIYNTFTPNGDGDNDTWGVPDLRFFSGGRIHVFERSGKRVFYTENPDERWDGTYMGRELPAGTYYWTVEVLETGEKRRGILTVLKH